MTTHLKRLFSLLVTLAAPTAALAHETGLGHAHPHTDWTALIALGLVVAAGALVLWKLRSANTKDNHHDPR